MKKYNLSKIMTYAWRLFRGRYRETFSQCLKIAWDIAKNAVRVDRWFADKKFLPTYYFFKSGKETEKAYLLNEVGENDIIFSTFWAPKSVCHSVLG